MNVQCAKPAACVLVCCLMLGPLSGFAADRSSDASTTPAADLDQVKQEWLETVDALKNYSAVQRDAAVASAEQALTAIDGRIERLEARTLRQWDKLTQSAREAREVSLRTLRTQRNQAAEWYGAMQHSSAGAWESVKQGFIDSYAVLSDSFSEAREEFAGGNAESP